MLSHMTEEDAMSTPLGRFDSGGQPPEDGRMERLEQRMDVVEEKLDKVTERIARVEERLMRVEEKMVTKNDFIKLIKLMVTLAFTTIAATVTLLTFVLNFMVLPRLPGAAVTSAPAATAANPQQPIVIKLASTPQQ
jgi:hypothetical protein